MCVSFFIVNCDQTGVAPRGPYTTVMLEPWTVTVNQIVILKKGVLYFLMIHVGTDFNCVILMSILTSVIKIFPCELFSLYLYHSY